MPRIVSLIASATEIVCALGFEQDLVARSHECDWPTTVTGLPVCTGPAFDVHGASRDIDRHVKTLLEQAMSLYHVDANLLRDLRPDVIVTQAQCKVCAVSAEDVDRALTAWLQDSPRVISLSPNNLAEVWESIRNVAEALGVSSRGEELVSRLQARCQAITHAVPAPAEHPTVACLEWLDPLMAAGNWVPELVERAGGRNLFGAAGKHSPWMEWDQLVRADPMILIAMPCGFDLARTRAEMKALRSRPEWPRLRAVRAGRVYATDGNQYFNRPGPRLVESLEILAEILHPEHFSFGHEGTGWARCP